jgi:transcriptional regulator with XRE-family HTH domain
VQIGAKIKDLRIKLGLTQSELAARTELSKGFISQLERDLASPSIATLVDILECLGTDLRNFFSEPPADKIVFGKADVFEKQDDTLGSTVQWLITSAQKNILEPILLTLKPGGSTAPEDPHAGEEFGYVLHGSILIELGGKRHRVKKGDSFYIIPSTTHRIINGGSSTASVLWVSSPPSF